VPADVALLVARDLTPTNDLYPGINCSLAPRAAEVVAVEERARAAEARAVPRPHVDQTAGRELAAATLRVQRAERDLAKKLACRAGNWLAAPPAQAGQAVPNWQGQYGGRGREAVPAAAVVTIALPSKKGEALQTCPPTYHLSPSPTHPLACAHLLSISPSSAELMALRRRECEEWASSLWASAGRLGEQPFASAWAAATAETTWAAITPATNTTLAPQEHCLRPTTAAKFRPHRMPSDARSDLSGRPYMSAVDSPVNRGWLTSSVTKSWPPPTKLVMLECQQPLLRRQPHDRARKLRRSRSEAEWRGERVRDPPPYKSMSLAYPASIPSMANERQRKAGESALKEAEHRKRASASCLNALPTMLPTERVLTF